MKSTFQPRKFLALLFLSLSFFLVSNFALHRDAASAPETVKRIIAEMKKSDKAANQEIYTYLSELYELSEYQQIWNAGTWKLGLNAVQDSRLHGLDPEDYRYSSLKKVQQKSNPNAKRAAEDIMRSDVLMSYAILLYSKHMIEGKTDPEAFYDTWNYQRRTFNDDVLTYLRKTLQTGKIEPYVSHITPQVGYYEILLRWMKAYYNGSLDDSPELQFASLPLKKGQTGDDIVELKYRLSQYGSYSSAEPNKQFDDELESAVKSFQKYMGLEQDGVVGKGTLAALNMSLDQKRDVMRVNMERARWLLHDLPEKFLLVNIAGYELYIFQDLKVVHQTPVIVGKPHHETPIFHADMKYVELNCTWTVPYSISSKELLPSIQKNPDYLNSRHFEVLQNGNIIDPSEVDWSKYSANNFPFTLRQKPGSFNSLGTMKFIFPNAYAIYLHDTPARYLFDKEGTRAFSHGCVRVKNPSDLAVSILGPQGVTKNDIREILDSEQTERIFLDKPLPVFLTYWTVFPDFTPEAPLHWVKDVYDRDNRILKALNN